MVKLLFSLPVVEISQNDHRQKLLRMFEHFVGYKAFSNGRTLLAQRNPTIFNECFILFGKYFKARIFNVDETACEFIQKI
jgi:hypothetical protein